MKRILAIGAVSVALSGTPNGAQEISGYWRSDGYGYLLEFVGDSARLFEVTQTTCVPAGTAIRVAGTEDRYRLAADGVEFSMNPGPLPDIKRFQIARAISDVVVRRIARRPRICDRPTPNTPAGNFEVFTRTWAEHYILFDQQRADWPATVALMRRRITPSMSPAALFDVLEAMIRPFENAHTYIRAPDIQRRFRTFRAGTDRVIKGMNLGAFMTNEVPVLYASTDRYLRAPLRNFCDGQLQHGHLNDSTGYLRILAESGCVNEGPLADELRVLEAALDTIFTDPALRALVIDVRINGGGSDWYVVALAARLTGTQYVAFSKEARLDPVDRTKWTPGQPTIIRPSTRPGFRGPVVQLIGPLTVSGGETMAQALMGRTPRVVRIGENTQGVFSDMLVRRLPNGWRFGLPNEVYRDNAGRIHDAVGIPPDIAVAVFADADVAAGRDAGIERALLELTRR